MREEYQIVYVDEPAWSIIGQGIRQYNTQQAGDAHGLLFAWEQSFTFSIEAVFTYQSRFDQCGVLVWIDETNWFKASIERETDEVARLGSVVTNHGHSDWATTDISPVNQISYRTSRRGPDSLIESSPDGMRYRRMRIFHLDVLGETTPERAKADRPHPPEQPIELGVYACSLLDASFEAFFRNPLLTECQWKSHG